MLCLSSSTNNEKQFVVCIKAPWRFHALSMAMSFICLQKTWESHSSETALRLLACEGVVGTIGPSKVLTHHIKL
jgi:hypothetical protein